jgi:hypothetical protein
MKASLIRFWLKNSGATAVEYSMIAAGIACNRGDHNPAGRDGRRPVRQRPHGPEIALGRCEFSAALILKRPRLLLPCERSCG